MYSRRCPSGSRKNTDNAGIHAITTGSSVGRPSKSSGVTPANVLRALRKAEFRTYGQGGAAELLGINGATLASRLKKLGIRPRDHKKTRLLSSAGRFPPRMTLMNVLRAAEERSPYAPVMW